MLGQYNAGLSLKEAIIVGTHLCSNFEYLPSLGSLSQCLRFAMDFLAQFHLMEHLALLAFGLRSFVYIFLLHFYASIFLQDVSILKSDEPDIHVLPTSNLGFPNILSRPILLAHAHVSKRWEISAKNSYCERHEGLQFRSISVREESRHFIAVD